MSWPRILGLWAPVGVFMALIYLLSERQQIPGAEYIWDKLLHVAGYALLGVLCLRAFHGGVRRPAPRPTVLAVLLTVAYGLFDEWHQSRTGRQASLLDWGADALGAGLAVLLMLGAWQWRDRMLGTRTRGKETG